MDENSKTKRKVCIVDDEANILEIYSTAFSKSGYDVVTAADGEEGLKVIRKQKPDIALIDIMMPKMDGMELMQELRKDPDLQQIPIIIMSNVNDSETMRKTGELGISFYLVKSLFDPMKVVDHVKEVLHNK
jgi:CheY-like chemotaxis protein